MPIVQTPEGDYYRIDKLEPVRPVPVSPPRPLGQVGVCCVFVVVVGFLVAGIAMTIMGSQQRVCDCKKLIATNTTRMGSKCELDAGGCGSKACSVQFISSYGTCCDEGEGGCAGNKWESVSSTSVNNAQFAWGIILIVAFCVGIFCAIGIYWKRKQEGWKNTF